MGRLDGGMTLAKAIHFFCCIPTFIIYPLQLFISVIFSQICSGAQLHTYTYEGKGGTFDYLNLLSFTGIHFPYRLNLPSRSWQHLLPPCFTCCRWEKAKYRPSQCKHKSLRKCCISLPRLQVLRHNKDHSHAYHLALVWLTSSFIILCPYIHYFLPFCKSFIW